MPIRLNLLAEAQAAEEMRRKDPVKRAIWIAALLVALMLGWASSLQLKAIMANKDLGTVQARVNQSTNEFNRVVEMQKQTGQMSQKIAALTTLSTNRFLTGNLLNALQHTTVEDVQLIHLKLDQTYALTEETKARTNGVTVIPGKPATVTEKTILTLDGHDSSPSPGDQVLRMKDTLGQFAYFKENLDRANPVAWKNSSAPQISPETGKAIVLFTLECRYPDKTR
jgi:hypothetical protein